MQLTVRQAARILAVSEKTVYRWLEAGEIPVQRVNEQFRFNRGELLEWATARGLPIAAEHFSAEDEAAAPVSLLEALEAGGIRRDVGGADRAAVLRAVVEGMRPLEPGDREVLFELLIARESMGSTAVGQGVAIPHPRNPVVLHVDRPAITLCFLARPVDFQALDGVAVDTLFTLVTPTIRTHLNLLARLAAALHDPGFRGAIQERAPDARILTEARRCEAELLARERDGAGGSA